MVLSIWDFIEGNLEEQGSIEAIDIDDEIDGFEKDRTRAIRRAKNRTKHNHMVQELGLKSIVTGTDKRKMLVCAKKVAEFNNSVRKYNHRPKDTESVRRYMNGEWYADVDSVDSEDASIEEPEIRFFNEWDVLVAVTYLRDEVYAGKFLSATTTEHYQRSGAVKQLLNMIENHSLKIWSEDGEILFTASEPLTKDMAKLLAIVLEMFEMWS